MGTMILNGLLRVEGRSCGDESSEWLERVLGIPGVHLVRGVRSLSPKMINNICAMRDHPITMIKNILCSVNNVKHAGESEEQPRHQVVLTCQRLRLSLSRVSWIRELPTIENKQPPTIAPSSHLSSNRLNSLRALASKVEETCAKHGEQFADHFGEKGIADRLKFSLR